VPVLGQGIDDPGELIGPQVLQVPRQQALDPELGIAGPAVLLPQDNDSWRRLADGANEVSPKELADLLASSYSSDARFADLGGGPLLTVLDTSDIRTGLHHQLAKGSPPASISTARDGSMRMFMEYETLLETQRKLPKFARQFGVPVAELTRILNEWLPYIRVVKIPPALRSLISVHSRCVVLTPMTTRRPHWRRCCLRASC
jgi:hypothetical protein